MDKETVTTIINLLREDKNLRGEFVQALDVFSGEEIDEILNALERRIDNLENN